MGVRLFVRIVARAIDAAVDAAGAAILGDRFAEVFAGAVELDAEVVPGQAELRGDGVLFVPLKVDFVQESAVSLGNEGQEAAKAPAELALLVVARGFRELFFETLQRPGPRALFAVKVDDGPAEYSIKPSDCLLVGFGMAVSGQGFDEALLHDILGEMVVAKAGAREGDERLEVFNDGVFDAGHAGSLARGKGCAN